MKIEKRIKLKNNYYYIVIDVEYKKSENGINTLCLKNYKDDYWDGGDCTTLIEKIEKSYTTEKAKVYEKDINFLADVMYIYDRIPFLSGIKDVYISKNDILPYSVGYISKSEIDKYIKDNGVIMTNNLDFKLYSEQTWNV